MRLIDGRTLAQQLLGAVRERVRLLRSPPSLAAVLIGDDPASHLYVKLKAKACAEVGIAFRCELLPSRSDTGDLLARLQMLNSDPVVTGIIVQLPLPTGFNQDEIVAAIDPAKDADGFQSRNLSAFLRGDPKTLTPGLIRAIWTLIAATGERLNGRRAVVLGNSPVFTQALVAFLERHGLRARSVDPAGPLRSASRDADVLIVAVGRPAAVGGADVKPGAIVVDVGTNRVGDRVVGDIDPNSVRGVAAWLSPVPGGVGPLTVASLLENVVALAERKNI